MSMRSIEMKLKKHFWEPGGSTLGHLRYSRLEQNPELLFFSFFAATLFVKVKNSCIYNHYAQCRQQLYLIVISAG